MDYSLITEQETEERANELPRNIINLLNSEETKTILNQISRFHYLNAERTQALEQLVGLVLLGFVSVNELAKEINENLFLNHEHANALAKEIRLKLLNYVKNELIYAPIEERPEEEKEETRDQQKGVTPIEQKIISFEKIGEEKIISIKGGTLETRVKEEGPLIIHEERPAASEPAIAKPMKTFSPFGFFRSKAGPEEKTAVKVRVETPEKKKEEVKRVVHYSEFRTPVAPLAGKEEFMGLDKFEKEAIAEAPIALIENAKPQEHSPEQIKPILQAKTFFSWPHKMQKEEMNNNETTRRPKLDGNIIDLS